VHGVVRDPRGVADPCALLTSFRSGTLVRAVLEHTGGTIRDSTAFSSLATEVASALPGGMWNDRTLAAAGADPHALAEALGGALYRVMAEMHERLLRVLAVHRGHVA
jgi:hypothetical protein